jgi:glycosyltransferase involved in cell wall biosynthesis
VSAAERADDGPIRSLQLGMGWFPDEPGGLNRYFRSLVEALAARGQNVEAVVRGPATDVPDSARVSPVAPGPLGPLLRRYAAAAREAGVPDVLDAHFALYALLPVRFGLRTVPLVVHFHGPWADESANSGDRAVETFVKRRVERMVYRRARETVVLSRAFRRQLVERYRVQPWHVNVIPPGVDLARFSPGDRAATRRSLGLPEDAWIAVTARRLELRMGLDVLIDAWREVAGDGRLLVVVGEGPSREDLEQQARRLGLSEDVRFVGRVDDADLVSHYRAADVSVVPSSALEGFGLVVLEALGCGTPVIVSDVGGLPEAIAGLGPDLVVPAGDRIALGRRLLAAVDGSQPLPASDRCVAHASRFTWEGAVNDHLAVYRRALRPSRRRPLRVVYLDHTAKLSGGELALLRLLPALDNVDAHVVLAEDGPLVSRLEAAGVSVEVMPLIRRAREMSRNQVGLGSFASTEGLASAAYVGRLARHLRRLSPDLVHTNSLKSALYGGVAGRVAGIPVIWHVRDRITDDYLPRRAVQLVRRAATVLPAGLIANSQTTLGTLPPLKRSWVIPSPIDVQPTTRTSTSGPLRFAILGRIAPWKGQDVFLRAFAKAFTDGDQLAQVIGAPLFGAKEAAYAQRLVVLANDLGLRDRVLFTGFADNIAEALRDTDVLVHASVLPEPFGQVIAEGMALGIPIVAAAAGGPAEIIEDRVNGILYPPGDHDALASALQELASDRSLRERVSAASADRAEQFSAPEIAKSVMAVYESFAGPEARTSPLHDATMPGSKA